MSDHHVVRVVDLCAGLGGFHHGIAKSSLGDLSAQVVFASELDSELRELYVTNFPSIADQLVKSLRPEDLATEIACPQLAARKDALNIFDRNGRVVRIPGELEAFVDVEQGDLRRWPKTGEPIIPQHDFLCAGFPCQPFSKSGAQRGFEDLRGTVFHLIAIIIAVHEPQYVLLENVGNFERHNGGATWYRVKNVLEGLGYTVSATRHKASGDQVAQGLLSPHHLGYPHHRERFFIAAIRDRQVAGHVPWYPFPDRPSSVEAQRRIDVESESRLRRITKDGWASLSDSTLPVGTEEAIAHWEELLELLRNVRNYDFRRHAPSFPIWGFELDPWQWYPIHDNPGQIAADPQELVNGRNRLLSSFFRRTVEISGGLLDARQFGPQGARRYLSGHLSDRHDRDRWIGEIPAYALKRQAWPRWKHRFITQNRDWALRLWTTLDPARLREWLDRLVEEIPTPSHQKLEWNCKGDELTLSNRILQFRPSGIRVKRFQHVPALVAMTSTQVPLLSRRKGVKGPIRLRKITTSEGLELQGFPKEWALPRGTEGAFKALGNAVHCDVVAEIAARMLDASANPGQFSAL